MSILDGFCLICDTEIGRGSKLCSTCQKTQLSRKETAKIVDAFNSYVRSKGRPTLGDILIHKEK